MPGSSNLGKIVIEQWVKSLPKTPKLILDVGPGWGTYSRLLKQKGQTWHAVEIHAPYITQFNLKKYYDEIFIEDIRTFRPRKHYDLVLLGDILEHIPNNDGINVLKTLLAHSSYIILSLPLDAETHAPSDNNEDYWDNPHERHQAMWSNKKFLDEVLSLGADVISIQKYQGLGVYLLSSNKADGFMFESVLQPSNWFRYKYGLKYETNNGKFKTKVLMFGIKFTPEWLKKIYRKQRKINTA